MAGLVMRVLARLTGVLLLSLLPIPALAAANGPSPQTGAGSPPLEVKADRIDYLQDQDIYEADGSVVIDQGSVHLTADHVTIQALPGVMIATGHVRLTDPKADIVAERLELNVNTQAGIITHGEVYLKASNTTVDGRLIQRFSEDHYRFKEGRFTNCDAPPGETPAWRFQFKDMDLNAGTSLAFKDGWFCVADVPVIPIPTMTYPLTPRQSGFLIPSPGYDNRFGFHYQQGYYWAINPSQDLTISPSYYTNLGYGSDFEYRYALDRKSRGQWYVSYLQQTTLPNVSGVTDTPDADAKRARPHYRHPYPASDIGSVIARQCQPRHGSRLPPATQQLGCPARASQQRIQHYRQPAVALRQCVSPRPIPAAVAVRRIGHVPAPSRGGLQSAEHLVV